MRDVQRDPGARVIYILSIALTAPIIITAFVRGRPIGAGTTICMLLAAASMIGLVIDWRHRARLPRARVVHPRRRLTTPPPPTNRALVVEDERALQDLLRRTLAPRGIDVVIAPTLAEGLHALETALPDIVLLDLGLPDGDGFELLREVRKREHTPVIVISARDREDDRTRALDAGADDYVLKPFDAAVLAMHVQHAIRRRPSHMTLPPGVRLGAKEQAVLAALSQRRGALVGYSELIDAVWGAESSHDVTELRLVVASLRRKIEKNPARPHWLVAEAGGYRLRDGQGRQSG